MKISVEKVENGFICKVGTGRPHVVAGHDAEALVKKLRELFGLKDEVSK